MNIHFSSIMDKVYPSSFNFHLLNKVHHMYEIHPQSSFSYIIDEIHLSPFSFNLLHDIHQHVWNSSIIIHFSSIMYEIHSQHTKVMHYCWSSFIIKLFVKSNKHGTRSHVYLIHKSHSPIDQFFKKLLNEAQNTILHQALAWIKFHVKLFCHPKAQLQVLPPSFSSFHASCWSFLLSFFFLTSVFLQWWWT